ncbi:MAG TPA: sulfite oxidase [Gemmatimonas sp.]|nr:sulfite oxidase [Gemmatimonas sp.]
MNDLDIIRRTPFNAETPEAALVEAETASAHVYVRSNFDMPLLLDDHTIRIHGAVQAPLEITVAELQRMQQHTVGATMECAGNDRLDMHPLPAGEPWRHGAISSVRWTGVPLHTVLAGAGLSDDTVEILFSGADAGPRSDAPAPVQFQRSMPVRDAMNAEVLLALAMNGQPLSREHGAPVRVVVPGWYGMASVKWLTSIEAVTVPFAGYFQCERYVYDEPDGVSPVTRMRVKSFITSPRADSTCGAQVTVHGWAWSGHGAITRVEIAIDGGESWRDAELGTPASPFAWTPFWCDLSLVPGARTALRSRATDAAGHQQPAMIPWNRLGYGNNAVRAITVDVAPD